MVDSAALEALDCRKQNFGQAPIGSVKFVESRSCRKEKVFLSKRRQLPMFYNKNWTCGVHGEYYATGIKPTFAFSSELMIRTGIGPVKMCCRSTLTSSLAN